jgi:hypothetical protein
LYSEVVTNAAGTVIGYRNLAQPSNKDKMARLVGLKIGDNKRPEISRPSSIAAKSELRRLIQTWITPSQRTPSTASLGQECECGGSMESVAVDLFGLATEAPMLEK